MKTIKMGGVPEHFNLPWHLAIEGKEFEKEDIKVTWKDFPDGTGTMCKALREGDLDGAVILTEGIIKDICAGNPVKIVQEYIATPLIWGIHVAAGSAFQKVEDLEGEKVAISRLGSGSHLMAYVNAARMGWSLRNLEFETVIDADGAINALQNNKAGYFMWEHFTTKPLVDQGIFKRLGDCPTPWPCFLIVFREEFLKKNSGEVKKLLTTINGITRDFKKRPGVEKLLSERYQQKPEDIKDWLNLTEWSQKQISGEEIDRVQEELKELNLISKKADKEFILHNL